MSRRHYTDKEKIEYLAEFTRSGGTAAAYCREQGLVYQTFMRWRRERNGDLELGQSAPATEFVDYKSGGINFVDGQLYWAADANGRKRLNETYDRGIFRCDPSDLADKSKHTRLYDLSYESANMIIEDDFMIASHCAPASPWNCDFAVSHDLGKTWAQCDLKELGKKSPLRFHPKNAEGWFRADLRTGWIDRSEVLFIKPKG